MAYTPEFTVKFDLDSESATFGKFVMVDLNTYAEAGYDPADVIGYFDITSPLGVYRTGSFDTPDTDGGASEWTYDGSDLPLVSIDQYLLGGYVFTYNVRITGVGDFSSEIVYTFCPPTTVVDTDGYIQDACENHIINTICSKLTIYDITDFGDYTTLAQSIELSPPALTGLPDVSTNSATLIYTYYWVNVAYSMYINDLVTYVKDNVTVAVRVDLTFTLQVNPSKLAPQLIKCWTGFVNYYTQQAALKGGAFNLSPTLQSAFITSGMYMQAFTLNTEIAEWAAAEALMPLIEACIAPYYNCNCGCETTKPMFVEPYCGGGSGSGSSYTFLATYPVEVEVSGDTVRYYLNATWLAALGELTEVTIASSDSSVTVTGGPAYNIAVKNHLTFTAKILYSAGGDYSVTVSNVTRQGTRYVSGYPAAAGDFQSINYPHASITVLKEDDCVFYIKNFLTTEPGGEIPDKVFVWPDIILNLGEATDDYSQVDKFRVIGRGKDAEGFYVALVDAITGSPIKNEIFIDQLQYIQFSILIMQ